MNWLKKTFNSSIGQKVIMACTGLALGVFLMGHLLGNLLLYAGPEAFNTYAANMQNMGALLWVARIGLLFVFATHLAVAIRLTLANKAARPVGYQCKNTVKASLASRTMVLTGLVILAFVIFHLAHFTLYWVDPSFAQLHDEMGRHDAYQMAVAGFKNPVVAGLYIVCLLLLGAHISHGFSSLFQSLGINHPHFNKLLRCGMPTFAWLLVLGFVSIPISVLVGIISFAGGLN